MPPSLFEFRDAIEARAFTKASPEQRITFAGSSAPREMKWLFDFRTLMLEPQWLNAYAEFFWERHADKLPFQVGGLETASIALVSAIVMKGVERGTPVNGFFIRKSRKREGLMKQVEGTLTDEPIILVDDILNTGKSFQKQILILEDLGKTVRELFAILTFRAQSVYAFAHTRGIHLDTLFTLRDFNQPLSTSESPEIPHDDFEELWKFSPEGAGFEHVVQKSTPLLDATKLYVGSDSGTFFALNQNDGSEAWRFSVGAHPPAKGIFSSPLLYKNTVYFGAYDGTMYALSKETGEIVWTYSEADWIGSSPTIAPKHNLLFVGLEFGLFRRRGGIAAVDCTTGAEKWIDRTPSLTHGSPLYIPEEDIVVIGSNDGILYAYKAGTGERIWTFQTEGDIKTRPAYDVVRKRVIAQSMDGKLYALNVRDGSVEWAFETGGPIYGNPLCTDDSAFVASLDKYLYALDLNDGSKKWSFATNGRIFASPVLAEQSLWIGSNDGRLYELNPATGALCRFHQFTERIVNAIAYNSETKLFFVPTVANEVYCLRRKQ